MWEKQINCSTRQSWRELIPTNVIFIVLYKGPGDLLLALFVSFTEIIHLEGRLIKRWLCFGCLRLMWNDGIVLLMWNDGIVFLGLEGKEILLWRLLEGKEIVCLRLHGRRVLEMMSNYFLLVAFGDAPSPSLRRVFFLEVVWKIVSTETRQNSLCAGREPYQDFDCGAPEAMVFQGMSALC